MLLNHLDLPVPDAAATADFFSTHFGLRAVHRENGFAILLDESGFALILNDAGDAAPASYPPAFHIGFLQPSAEAVHAIAGRLQAAGVDVPAPREEYGATVTFLRAPGGIPVEISHRPARA